MRVFALKTCDTCRKAVKALKEAGYTPQVVDVRADGVSDQDLDIIVETFGDAALNTSSATWRGLDEAEKSAAPRTLLKAHPTVMKRPVIAGDVWTIGWSKDVQEQWLTK